jgi:Ca2+:H+ antiporter
LLPLVSYAGDGLNTIMFFIRSNLMGMNVAPPDDLAKAKSIDLSIQFTLFWIPTLVLTAWGLNEPLTLLFGASRDLACSLACLFWPSTELTSWCVCRPF